MNDRIHANFLVGLAVASWLAMTPAYVHAQRGFMARSAVNQYLNNGYGGYGVYGYQPQYYGGYGNGYSYGNNWNGYQSSYPTYGYNNGYYYGSYPAYTYGYRGTYYGY